MDAWRFIWLPGPSQVVPTCADGGPMTRGASSQSGACAPSGLVCLLLPARSGRLPPQHVPVLVTKQVFGRDSLASRDGGRNHHGGDQRYRVGECSRPPRARGLRSPSMQRRHWQPERRAAATACMGKRRRQTSPANTHLLRGRLPRGRMRATTRPAARAQGAPRALLLVTTGETMQSQSAPLQCRSPRLTHRCSAGNQPVAD